MVVVGHRRRRVSQARRRTSHAVLLPVPRLLKPSMSAGRKTHPADIGNLLEFI